MAIRRWKRGNKDNRRRRGGTQWHNCRCVGAELKYHGTQYNILFIIVVDALYQTLLWYLFRFTLYLYKVSTHLSSVNKYNKQWSCFTEFLLPPISIIESELSNYNTYVRPSSAWGRTTLSVQDLLSLHTYKQTSNSYNTIYNILYHLPRRAKRSVCFIP